jgi:hypothetical protein
MLASCGLIRPVSNPKAFGDSAARLNTDCRGPPRLALWRLSCCGLGAPAHYAWQ